MRKFLLFVIAFCYVIDGIAQLKVISSGNVGIGTTNPSDLLQVGDGVNSNISISSFSNSVAAQNKGFIGTYDDYVGFSINRGVSNGYFSNPDRAHAEVGLFSNDKDSYIRLMISDDNAVIATEKMRIDKIGRVGIGVIPYISSMRLDVLSRGEVQSRVGTLDEETVKSWVTNSKFGYALGVDGSGNGVIFGDFNAPQALMTFNPSGNFAIGTSPSSFRLELSGSAHCSGTWQPSDKRYKKNIKPIENALEKVNRLNGRSYEYNKEFKEMDYISLNGLGFIAQELREVLPEAVYENEKGYLSVNYDFVIPVLVEAIKEQNMLVKSLESQLVNCCVNLPQNKVNENKPSITEIKVSQLFQNNPNPFNSQTKIYYYIPSDTRAAFIMIFDLQGKMLKSYSISAFAESAMSINANEFNPGMFIYTLIVDGKEIDSKKMILTE